MINSIPDEFQEFVSSGIESGRFRSEEEAIAAGLRLLREHDRRIEALRADLQIGIEQLNRGEKTEFDFADIVGRGRERRQASGNS